MSQLRQAERALGHSLRHHLRVYVRFWFTLKRGVPGYVRRGSWRALDWPWSVTAPWRIVYRTWRNHREDMRRYLVSSEKKFLKVLDNPGKLGHDPG